MDYVENNYRMKKIGGRYLATTDHGEWAVLDEKGAQLLRSGNLLKDSKLFESLKRKGFIITEDNVGGVIEKQRQKYSFLWQGTALHIVIPTLRCNEKCVYCHASSKPGNSTDFDMDRETAKSTVDFIFQSPSNYIMIEFQGGEPLMNFDIVKFIIKYAQKLNRKAKKKLRFSLVSNFSLMDEERMDYLIENKVGICTSLDGPEWLHNKNRPFKSSGGQSSYEKARKWIRYLSGEYAKRKVRARRANALITITRSSLGHWKGIIDEYVSLGLDDIFLRFLNNLGDARKTWNAISYSPEEYIDFWKKALDYIIELNKGGTEIREWFTWIILQKVMRNIEPNYSEQRSPCGAVIGQMTYNHNGDIYTCDEARMVGEDLFKLGNVKEKGYREVAASNQACSIVASSVNDVQICDSCVFKPYCGLCPVCNFAEQGSIIGKVSESSRCKIYMAQFEYIFDKIINDAEAKKVFMKWLERR